MSDRVATKRLQRDDDEDGNGAPLRPLLFNRHLFANVLLPHLDLRCVWALYCTCVALRAELAALPDVKIYHKARMKHHGMLAGVLSKRYKHKRIVPLRCVEHYFAQVASAKGKYDCEFSFHNVLIDGAAVSLDFVRAFHRLCPSTSQSYDDFVTCILCGAMRTGCPTHFAAVRAMVGEERVRNLANDIGDYGASGYGVALYKSAFRFGHPEFALRVWAGEGVDLSDPHPDGLRAFIEHAMDDDIKSTAVLDYAVKRWPQRVPDLIYEKLIGPEPCCSLKVLRWSLSMLRARHYPIDYERVFGAMWEDSDSGCIAYWFNWLAPLARAQFDARWRLDPNNAVPWASDDFMLIPGKLATPHYLWDHPWNMKK